MTLACVFRNLMDAILAVPLGPQSLAAVLYEGLAEASLFVLRGSR